ncbi:hypothetical protein Avbf_04023 [Armadillidium vulgare]|nr:hypothetical protein Avbf_04023 [Armadillidium vulgare]
MIRKEQPSAIFAAEVALRARLRNDPYGNGLNDRKSDPILRSTPVNGILNGSVETPVRRPKEKVLVVEKTPVFNRKQTPKKKKKTRRGQKLTKEEEALQKELSSSLAERNKDISMKNGDPFTLTQKRFRKFSWPDGVLLFKNRRFSLESRLTSENRASKDGREPSDSQHQRGKDSWNQSRRFSTFGKLKEMKRKNLVVFP